MRVAPVAMLAWFVFILMVIVWLVFVVMVVTQRIEQKLDALQQTVTVQEGES